MLKLIYSVSAKEITLKYHKRSPFFSKTLLLSLLISLSVHLALGFVFQIKSLRPSPDVFLLPTQVLAELVVAHTSAPQASIDTFGFLSSKLEAPRKAAFIESSSNQTIPFSFEEEWSPLADFAESLKALESPAEPPKLAVYKTTPPVKIFPSDNLSELLLLPKFKAKEFLIGQTETLFCKFSVEFDNKTGQLFSMELIESTGNPNYDRHAKNLLKKIKSRPSKNFFSTKGEVSLYIEAANKDAP